MKKKNGKAKKWQLYAAIGAASVVVLWGLGASYSLDNPRKPL